MPTAFFSEFAEASMPPTYAALHAIESGTAAQLQVTARCRSLYGPLAVAVTAGSLRSRARMLPEGLVSFQVICMLPGSPSAHKDAWRKPTSSRCSTGPEREHSAGPIHEATGWLT